VPGEHVAPLASLPLPTTDDATSVAASDAGALFVVRAGEARGGFVIDDTNAASVRALCARLDGVALAIELAAAQTRLMTAAEIVTRLDRQFRLLTGGRRTRLERHHTLRAAIDWSYNLLGDDERAFLDRLSVCVGGFDLDAAIAIATGIGLDEFEAIEHLDALVAKSLVERNDRAGVTRYRLLEMIRQYAAERLNTAGLADAARDDHSIHYLALAIALGAEAASASGFAALERLDTEIANIAAARTWLLETDRAGALMDFFGDMPFVDTFAVPITVGADLGAIATKALETGATSHPAFARTCWWASVRAFFNGDMATFRGLADLARSSPPSDTSAVAIYLTAVGAMFDGNAEEAVATTQLAVEQARREDDPAQLAWLLGQLCGFQTMGAPDAALGTAEESLTVARAAGSPVMMLYPLMSMMIAARHVDPPRAIAAGEECERVDATQRQFHSNTVRAQLGAIRLAAGQIADGLAMSRAVLGTYHDNGERALYTVALCDVAHSLIPIDPVAAIALAAIAEGDDAAPYAAFGFSGLAELAAERRAEVSAARSRASKLTYDEATASVLATLDRLISEHQS
jgi:hypothetical protein